MLNGFSHYTNETFREWRRETGLLFVPISEVWLGGEIDYEKQEFKSRFQCSSSNVLNQLIEDIGQSVGERGLNTFVVKGFSD